MLLSITSELRSFAITDCQARKLNKEDAMDHCKREEVDKGCQMVRMGVSG